MRGVLGGGWRDSGACLPKGGFSPVLACYQGENRREGARRVLRIVWKDLLFQVVAPDSAQSGRCFRQANNRGHNRTVLERNRAATGTEHEGPSQPALGQKGKIYYPFRRMKPSHDRLLALAAGKVGGFRFDCSEGRPSAHAENRTCRRPHARAPVFRQPARAALSEEQARRQPLSTKIT